VVAHFEKVQLKLVAPKKIELHAQQTTSSERRIAFMQEQGSLLGGGWGPRVSAGGPRTHCMFLTSEVSHVERSPLKPSAFWNMRLLCAEHRSTPNEQATPARWSHVHCACPTPHGARLAAWWWLGAARFCWRAAHSLHVRDFRGVPIREVPIVV
jgi:hypothetical protein